MLAMITTEKWLQGEVFYNTVVPILLVVGLVVIMLVMMVVLYRHDALAKKVGLIGGGLVLLLGAVFVAGNHYYQEYKTLSQSLTPAIRDREKNFVGYDYYDRETVNAFKRIQTRKEIESLGLYRKKAVMTPIEYLGYAHGSVYFKIGAQLYYLRTEPTFEKTEQAKLEGIQYLLTDASFAKIGFVTETTYYLDQVIIPEKDRDLVYQQADGTRSKEFGKSQGQWTTKGEE